MFEPRTRYQVGETVIVNPKYYTTNQSVYGKVLSVTKYFEETYTVKCIYGIHRYDVSAVHPEYKKARFKLGEIAFSKHDSKEYVIEGITKWDKETAYEVDRPGYIITDDDLIKIYPIKNVVYPELCDGYKKTFWQTIINFFK